MDAPQTSESLSRTIAAWRVAPPRNRDFRAAVWSRIEAGARALPWRVYARQHATALAGALAVAIVAGAYLGRGSAQARVAAERARLAAAYVQGLDARAMQMP